MTHFMKKSGNAIQFNFLSLTISSLVSTFILNLKFNKMKNYILLFTLLFSFSVSAQDLYWYDVLLEGGTSHFKLRGNSIIVIVIMRCMITICLLIILIRLIIVLVRLCLLIRLTFLILLITYQSSSSFGTSGHQYYDQSHPYD